MLDVGQPAARSVSTGSPREIPADLEDAGRRPSRAPSTCASGRSTSSSSGCADGSLVPLEVNMRPPGGPSVDMCELGQRHRLLPGVGERRRPRRLRGRRHAPVVTCMFAARRDVRPYRLSHDEVLARFGEAARASRADRRRLLGRDGRLRLHPARPDLEPLLERAADDPGASAVRQARETRRSHRWWSADAGPRHGLCSSTVTADSRARVPVPGRAVLGLGGLRDGRRDRRTSSKAARSPSAIDGIDGETWNNQAAHPADRARRHEAYDRYVADEVVPLLQREVRRDERWSGRPAPAWARSTRPTCSSGGRTCSTGSLRSPACTPRGVRRRRRAATRLLQQPARLPAGASTTRGISSATGAARSCSCRPGRLRGRRDRRHTRAAGGAPPRKASTRHSTTGATTWSITGVGGARCCAITSGGCWRSRRGREGLRDYSPITAQRKPIMMKKPLNRAISPMPP